MKATTIFLFLLVGVLLHLDFQERGKSVDAHRRGMNPFFPNHNKRNYKSHHFTRPKYRGNLQARSFLSSRAVNSTHFCEAFDDNPRFCVNIHCFWCCSDEFCHQERSDAVDCDKNCPFAINICGMTAWTSSSGIRYGKDILGGGSPPISVCEFVDQTYGPAAAFPPRDNILFQTHALYYNHTIQIPIYDNGDYQLIIGIAEPESIHRYRNMGAILNGMHQVYRGLNQTSLRHKEVIFIQRLFRVSSHPQFPDIQFMAELDMGGWPFHSRQGSLISNNAIRLELFSEDWLVNKDEAIRFKRTGIIQTLVVKRIA